LFIFSVLNIDKVSGWEINTHSHLSSLFSLEVKSGFSHLCVRLFIGLIFRGMQICTNNESEKANWMNYESGDCFLKVFFWRIWSLVDVTLLIMGTNLKDIRTLKGASGLLFPPRFVYFFPYFFLYFFPMLPIEDRSLWSGIIFSIAALTCYDSLSVRARSTSSNLFPPPVSWNSDLFQS